jgi:hypothetical protein
LCEMAGENCLRYYAISESERRWAYPPSRMTCYMEDNS